MNKKVMILAVVAVTTALALLAGSAAATPGTLYVDENALCGGNSPCYTTINGAIGSASNGDTVKVYPGVYRELVIVNKEVTLEAAQGQPEIENIDSPPNTTENDGAVRVTVSNVTVRGFMLVSDDDVLAVSNCGVGPISNVVIEDNHIKGVWTDVTEPGNHRPGIFACAVDNLTVQNNTIQNTTGMGIFLGLTSSGTDVTNSLIEGNLVVDSEYTGIGLVRGSYNTVRGNDVRSAGQPEHNLDDGIRLGKGATNNTVEENRVSGSSRDGIRAVPDASGNTIQNNKSTGNARYDISDETNSSYPLCDNAWTGNKFKTKYGCATN